MSTLKEYKDKFKKLKSYTTEQEKNTLLKNLEGNATSMEMIKSLGYDSLNENEAHAMIFKLREISVSDIVDMTLTCENCDYQDIHIISIPNMFFQDDDFYDIDIGLFVDASDLSDENIENINIQEFDSLTDRIEENNRNIFNPEVEITCKKCGHKSTIAVTPGSIISKFDIKNIYEQYIDITTFTNMTKADVDSMFPFEREIFMGLIQQKEDDKEKKAKQGR